MADPASPPVATPIGDDLVVYTNGRPPAEEITSLALAARDYAAAGKAANTQRAYRSDFADFASWCSSVGASPLPADPAAVALYLTARAPHLAASTLERRLAAIRSAHAAAGLVPPASPELTAVWAGIRRTHGRPPRKKRGLLTEDLKRVLKKLRPGLAGIRDRALLLLGFAGALRREELAALDLDAGAVLRLVFVSEGIEIHVGHAKGDQEGRGSVVAIPHGRTHCPVSAVRAWLEAAGVAQGAVFREVDRHGRVGDAPIGGKAVARIVKENCARAGFPPAEFAGHSLRRGMITSAAKGGAAPDVLMRHARHSRFDTTLGYIEAAQRFKNNAARATGL